MSFKRDGDDPSQLNLLKKRRVSDLLAENIPEEEAFLMRNGRYACMVCHYRPVFNTIPNLVSHRSGKKHRSGLEAYYAKKRDLMREAEERRQYRELMKQEKGRVVHEKDEDASPLLTQTRKATHHALLTSVPYKGYKSTSTTVQGQTFSEKRRSFFQTVFANSLQGGVWLPSASQKQALPGNGGSSINNQPPETPCAGNTTRDEASVSQDGDVAEGDHQQGVKKQSDDSFTPRTSGVPLTLTEKRQPATFELKPYVPKNQRNRQDQTEELLPSEEATAPAPNVKSEDIPIKEPLYFESLPTDDVSEEIVSKPDEAELKQTVPIPSKNEPIHGKKVKKHSKHHKAESKVSEDAKSKEEREQYFKMTSSGWKSDWRGGWVKDEDVEFDSDEDEPTPINN
ncbi:uncharacterized protein [Asterias amurensis]|uniref:uncharacterized protein n=1 Tax=Asterias amurensis TaxID=7602 RepID=UPI003AB41F4F